VSTKSANPTVDTSQIMAAGLAATGAAFVTSRFGVAGTLFGAAVTAMIITGGSAILKAYLQNAAGRVRAVPTRLRSGREATQADAETAALPRRPDLRNNFVGRMRAAIDWFRSLPTSGRRPILIKGLVAAAVAFVICMVAIWGFEKIIGNSLSCGLWGSCPYGAVPGVHIAGFDDSGAGSSISGGGVDLGGGGAGGVIDSIRQNPVVPDGPDFLPGGADSSASPAASPDPVGGASPEPGGETPSSASPAAEPAPAEEEAPSSASPAAGRQGASDSSASPAP
jgi:hypothetical protein